MDHFELVSEYQPTGDQPQAIEKLVKGFQEGNQFETLLGVTGSGKTFTMANVIAKLNKPTLVLAHNKTLAAQLYGEMKEFFPENAVEYFVSYYDYYQPEAYVPSTDTYIAKDASTNDEIDKLRLSATAALCERKDVIVVSSVSCIYGLGAPEEFFDMMISLRPGMEKDRDDVIRELIDIQYNRNEMDFHRGTFRVHGDVVEIFPAGSGELAVRVEFFGDEVDRITEVDVLTGEIKRDLKHIAIFPASHYVVSKENMERATRAIEVELEQQVLKYEAVLASQGADTEQGALLLPQLFYDSGSGFSPHECLTVAPDSYDELTHEVSAVFELPVEARALRLDPGEFACCITDFSLSDERLSYHILNGNALQEGTMLFMNIDPNLTVESAVGFPAGLRFAVKYRYYPLGRYLHEQPGKALLRALTVLKEETEAVSRQGTEQLLEANAEIQQLRKLLAEQQQHLTDLQNSRAAYEASLENVLASSSWKLTAPLRKLLGLFHRH